MGMSIKLQQWHHTTVTQDTYSREMEHVFARLTAIGQGQILSVQVATLVGNWSCELVAMYDKSMCVHLFRMFVDGECVL